MKKSFIAFVSLLLLIVGTLHFEARADIPRTIGYQGVLSDTDGNLLPDGSYTLTFSIYDVPGGGEALFTESVDVETKDGVFEARIGSAVPINLDFDKQYFVGITVAGEAEMSPRIPFNTVPYAFMAASVEDGSITREKLADGATVTSINGLSGDPQIVAGEGVSIEIVDENIVIDGFKLPFSGTIEYADPAFSVENTGTGDAAQFINSNPQSEMSAVYGEIAGTGSAIYGTHSESQNFGLIADADLGVYGLENSTGSFGLLGGDKAGVEGEHGIKYNFGQLGTEYEGVYGQNDSSGHFGAVGTKFEGVYGESSTQYYGLLGSEDRGVEGGDYLGNWAYIGGFDYAGYFYGDVDVAGFVSKTGGSFKIDHPLDPENKFLYHSFVESPDMMNVYNGNVTLDEEGRAVVELPDYFQALNADYRYQLTPIGGPGPNLYIASEIEGNQFEIAGGSPGLKVSWQVTGVRVDPAANLHRIQVVEEKTPEEQGKYVCPEAYGKSRGNAIKAPSASPEFQQFRKAGGAERSTGVEKVKQNGKETR